MRLRSVHFCAYDWGMSPLPSPSELEARAKSAGMSMREVCRSAGVSPSTFSRWKSGATSPTFAAFSRMVGAIDRGTPAASERASA